MLRIITIVQATGIMEHGKQSHYLGQRAGQLGKNQPIVKHTGPVCCSVKACPFEPILRTNGPDQASGKMAVNFHEFSLKFDFMSSRMSCELFNTQRMLVGQTNTVRPLSQLRTKGAVQSYKPGQIDFLTEKLLSTHQPSGGSSTAERGKVAREKVARTVPVSFPRI